MSNIFRKLITVCGYYELCLLKVKRCTLRQTQGNKKTPTNSIICGNYLLVVRLIQRRERDSNPRYPKVQRFSRPPQSTTLPSLQYCYSFAAKSTIFWLCKCRYFFDEQKNILLFCSYKKEDILLINKIVWLYNSQ